MLTAAAPTVVESTSTSEYDYRVLFLNGKWEMPENEFQFRATITVEKDGSAHGTIFWTAVKVWGVPTTFRARECVAGFVCGVEVELRGQAVEKGLCKDHYKITLSGSDGVGAFGGISRGHGAWNGVTSGKYYFNNRKK